VEQPRSFTTNEFAEEIDWDDPVLVLRSHNRSVSLWQLDPSGQYRIRGFLRRWLRPEDVHLVEPENLQMNIADEEIPPE